MPDPKDKLLHCLIHTPDGTVLETQAVSVKAPALDGYMGVLPGRAPVTAVVAAGLLTILRPGGQTDELFVSRGFLQVRQDNVAVLAEECKPIDKIDLEQAWDLLQRANRLPQATDRERLVHDEAVHTGRIRFALAQKAHKKDPQGGELSMNAMRL